MRQWYIKVGTAVVVRLEDGELLAVEFDSVFRRQQQRGKPRSFLREVFSLDPLTTIGKSTRLARQPSRDFAAALITAGALDKTGAMPR
jgi:hypothetical protein